MRRTIAQTALVFTSALLIMALVGCGGSSKQTAVTPDPTPDPMPTPTPDPPAAISGLPAGHTLTAGTTIAAGASREILEYSKGQSATITCPTAAGAAGCVVSENAAGALVATGSPTVAVMTDEMVWQANNGPAGTSGGAHARGVVTDLAGSAIATEAVTRPAGGAISQSTKATEEDITPAITWTNGAAPTKVELTLGFDQFGSFTVADDAAILGTDPGKLAMTSGETPNLGAGWTSVAVKKEHDFGLTLHGVVHSDIAAPEGGTPSSAARSAVMGLDLSSVAAVSTAVDPSEDAPTAAVKIPIVSDIGTNPMLSIPVATLNAFRTGALQTSTIMDMGLAVTYDDATGEEQSRPATMACATVAGCRVVRGSLQGSWDIALRKVDAVPGTQDPRYIVLGSWLSLPSTSGAADAYDMGAFADSQGAMAYAHARNEIEATTAELEYEGPATGLYATGSYSSAGTLTRDATVGSFTAATELTATFTGTSTFGGVVGSVTDFEENGQSLGNWQVSLRETPDAAGRIFFTGATAGVADGRNLTGQWGVQFYVSDAASPLNSFGYAVGTFSATTGASAANQEALHIVGAFGATRQP